jgi:hypothetical protein
VLKLIEGLLHPDAGEVLLEGHDLSTANTRELLELRGLLGIQFQSGASPRSLSRAFARSLPGKHLRLITSELRWVEARGAREAPRTSLTDRRREASCGGAE